MIVSYIEPSQVVTGVKLITTNTTMYRTARCAFERKASTMDRL